MLIDSDKFLKYLKEKDHVLLLTPTGYDYLRILMEKFEILEPESPEVKKYNPVKSYVLDGETWYPDLQQKNSLVVCGNDGCESYHVCATPEQILGIEEKGDE